MKTDKSELRMPADKFDRLMRKALQIKPSVRKPKAATTNKKAAKK